MAFGIFFLLLEFVDEGEDEIFPFADRLGTWYASAKRGAGADEFGVGGDSFTEVDDGSLRSGMFHDRIEVFDHLAGSLEPGRRLRDSARGQVRVNVAKDPKIAESLSTDHDAGAAGLVDHSFGVLGSVDVAVTEDGDVSNGLGDGANPVEIDLAGELLHAVASVDGEGGDADIFELTSKRRGDQVSHFPTEPGFDSDGTGAFFDDSLGDSNCIGTVTKHTASTTFAGNLGDGATEVDVDGQRASLGGPESRLGEFVGIGAEQLDSERPIVRSGFNELNGSGATVHQTARVDEFRERESKPAQGTNQAAVNEIGVARQRTEKQIRFNLHRADSNGHKTILHRSLLMFTKENPPTNRRAGLIRTRMEPLVAAASGF